MTDRDSQYEHDFVPPNAGWQHRGNGGVYAPIDASNNKALPWIATAMLIAGIAVALAMDARIDAQRAERESRMLQMYVLELDAKLVAVGYKTDAESLAKKLREKP